MSKSFAIFDLDNCIADDAWRIPFVAWSAADSGKRYDVYHRACGGDKPGNLEKLAAHIEAGDVIMFLTGRPTAVREQTRVWIDAQLRALRSTGAITVQPTFHLLMRRDGDERSSVSIKRDQLLSLRVDWELQIDRCTGAYDDREDIVEMYRNSGVNASVLRIHDVDAYSPPAPASASPQKADTAAILAQMAATFRERNAVYKENAKMAGEVLAALYPNGVTLKTAADHEWWHVWCLLFVKLTRFVVSEHTHVDSIHDLAVYAAIIETRVRNAQRKETKR
jgi:hypothetical protein